jgi:hypothetical protein
MGEGGDPCLTNVLLGIEDPEGPDPLDDAVPHSAADDQERGPARPGSHQLRHRRIRGIAYPIGGRPPMWVVWR